MADEEEYQVEQILDHTFKDGKHLYLIKWEGYDSDENTWEPRGEHRLKRTSIAVYPRIEQQRRDH